MINTTLIAVRNPKWLTIKLERYDADGKIVNDAEGKPIMDIVNDSEGNPIKVIECECQWSHLGDETQEWLPFTADLNDTEQHGKDLYTALVNGDHEAIADED